MKYKTIIIIIFILGFSFQSQSFFGKEWKPEIKEQIEFVSLYTKLHELAPTAQIIFNDRHYLIPADPEDVMINISSWRYKYWYQKRDCDDFVRIFRGKLSEKRYGNLVAMDCLIEYYVEGVKKRHSLIAFLYNDKIIFGEPQQGKIVIYNDARIVRIIL